MSKLSKEKTQQIALVWIFAAAGAVLLWWFGVSSVNAKRRATNDAVTAAQAKIEDGNKKKQRANASKDALRAVEKDLKEKEDGMASGELFAWVDGRLNTLIAQHLLDVDIPTKTRGEAVEVGLLPAPPFPYKAVKYAVKGTAYYHEFGKFVANFENTFPYIRIQNIEITPGGQFESSDPERLNFRFEIVALQKPVEEAAPAPAAKK